VAKKNSKEVKHPTLEEVKRMTGCQEKELKEEPLA
jgi:hypothetical protein